ncbi:MAG: hypothetical protein IPQ00_03285 [Chloracidobacterium sp.]|nr:hypothetical protein [Chloracidobacterium sp.]
MLVHSTKRTGCLVHLRAKPLPCIQLACYESAADLPPDELLDQAEAAVDDLNRRTFAHRQPLLAIPTALERFASSGELLDLAADDRARY